MLHSHRADLLFRFKREFRALVDMRGLTHEEIAAMLDVSPETVKLDWRKAKAFLKVHLASTDQEQEHD